MMKNPAMLVLLCGFALAAAAPARAQDEVAPTAPDQPAAVVTPASALESAVAAPRRTAVPRLRDAPAGPASRAPWCAYVGLHQDATRYPGFSAQPVIACGSARLPAHG